MTADAPTILATSMGFSSRDRNEIDYEPGPIFPYAFELARASAHPKLCFIGTATGDAVTYLATFYAAFAAHEVQTSHLALFAMPNVEDVRAHLLSQDVIWVGGGSTANLLAVWRVHGLDRILSRMLGVRSGAGRCLGRFDLLARGRHHRFVRTAARTSHRRTGLSSVLERGALRRRGTASTALS
jgi:hypothetical protein